MKTAGQNDDAFLAFIRRRKLDAFLLVQFPGHFHFLLLFATHLGLQLRERGSRFIFRQEHLAGSESVFQAPQNNGRVDFDLLLVQVAPEVHSERITEFVFLRLERQDALRSGLSCWSRLGRRGLLSTSRGSRLCLRRRRLLSLRGRGLLRQGIPKQHHPSRQ